MLRLIDLPPEVVTAILGLTTPNDLVSARQVCHWMNNCIRHNAQLCRIVYCNYFDVPPTKNLDWEREIQDYLRLQNICANTNPNKTSELPFVCQTVKRILGNSARVKAEDTDTLFRHRSFRNVEHLSKMLNTQSNHVAFFCRSFLFDRMRAANETGDSGENLGASVSNAPLPFPEKPSERHQMSAELHCLLGTVLLSYPILDQKFVVAYQYAVSKVYDMREHTQASLWGPFMADGSRTVDWEKLEAILIVLRYNIRTKGLLKFPILNKYWNNTFLGSWQESYMPMIRSTSSMPSDMRPLDLEDPYGVTGTWMRLVCFLDYRDFFRFNFDREVPDNMPRAPFDAGEELRFIIMKVQVTKIEPPGADDHPDFPVVYFKGASHSMDNPWDDNANSELEGTVRTTKEGQIHWTTFSLFEGTARWRSESIQVGGRRSGRGVIGYWFDTNYDPQGPCGPTAFWKLHEKKTMETTANGPVEAFSYLLTNSAATNGVNIVINITQPFAQFIGGVAAGDGEENDEEGDSDFDDNGGNIAGFNFGFGFDHGHHHFNIEDLHHHDDVHNEHDHGHDHGDGEGDVHNDDDEDEDDDDGDDDDNNDGGHNHGGQLNHLHNLDAHIQHQIHTHIHNHLQQFHQHFHGIEIGHTVGGGDEEDQGNDATALNLPTSTPLDILPMLGLAATDGNQNQPVGAGDATNTATANAGDPEEGGVSGETVP